METNYKPVKFKCHEKLQRISASYWEKAAQTKSLGMRTVWCSGLVPAEFLTAMDFFPVYVMNNSATCGVRGASLDLCQIAEAEGYSPDLCSYPRTDIGLALGGENVKSPIHPPKPDLLVVGNGQCHSITKWLESLARIFDVPVFLIDTPRLHDDMHKETYSRAHAYVKQQLLELISFLEEFTGSPFNYAKLEGSVTNSSRMFRMWSEALDLRRNVPSPLSAFDIFTHLFPVLGLRGTAEAADYYEVFKEEVAERVANKIGTIPEEKFRLHLDSPPMWFGLKSLAGKFASYGAVPVTHVYPLIFGVFTGLEASDPVDSTAKCLLDCYLNRGTKQRTDILAALAQKYRLDGLTMQIARTCKALAGGVPDIIAGVEKKIGIPAMTYETDHCDPRLYSEAQVDTRLAAFFEILEMRSRGR